MIKIIAFALIATLAYVLVKELKPEFGVLFQLVAGGALLIMIMPEIKTALNFAEEFFDQSLVDKKVFALLVKSLGITIISQFAADTCRDNGVNALASKIELGGRAIILVMSLPMISGLVKMAMGMIN